MEVLPAKAAEILKKAAQTQNTSKDPRARQKSVERAIDKVKALFPQYFR